MSSILKALRKLEEEKAALDDRRVDIARDILKRSAPQKRRSLPPFLWLAGIVLVVGFALWLRLPAFAPQAPVAEAPPPKTSAATAQTHRAKEPSVQQPQQPSVLVTSQTQNESIPAQVPVAGQPREAEDSRRLQEESAVQHQLPSAGVESLMPESKRAGHPLTQAETPTARATNKNGEPFLRLSAIVFRHKAEQRIAIINDLPVMEGTLIEGALVREIAPQQVTLDWQGKTLLLPLSAN